MPDRFDLLVIGSGPAGQKGAIAAAKIGKRVAVIDRARMVGGVCVHTGTIPSKTLREAIVYLSGIRQRAFYGRNYTVKEHITASDLFSRVDRVVQREMDVVRAQLKRNNVTSIAGTARFLDPNTLEVDSSNGLVTLTGDHVLIACGTRPAESKDIPLDGKRIFNADHLLDMRELPEDMVVVGAGVVGLEYASMFAALGIQVTLIEARPAILDFVDREIIDALSYHLRALGATFRLGEKVVAVENDVERARVVATLESGKRIQGDCLLYTVGRQANTDFLNLEAAGLDTDTRGRLTVNENFQTKVPHIYAAGDVIGFPSLAGSSMRQGRLASCHMFGVHFKNTLALFPYGIYTIPEISMVGRTEQQLTQDRIPYEFGVARFNELARGQILGDETGLLKLLFDPKTLRLLGVHGIGEQVSELIHVGQAVMALEGTLEYFRDAVFNYPTLAEAYKVAALDGLNKIT